VAKKREDGWLRQGRWVVKRRDRWVAKRRERWVAKRREVGG
jgi:hypothetical protein